MTATQRLAGLHIVEDHTDKPSELVKASSEVAKPPSELAKALQLPLLEQPPTAMPTGQFVLYWQAGELSLRATGRKAPGPVLVDFVSGAASHRRHFGGGKSQLIAKAVGIKGRVRPSILDVTAGLGQDGFVLATLGCPITLVERSGVVHALLANGLFRARLDASDAALQEILARLTLHQHDSIAYLRELNTPADVIYIDPMFPESAKAAKVNKAMQAFHQLVGADDDAGELLQVALEKARYRVVVKRPRKAPGVHQQYPALNLPSPGLVLSGKSTRFDIYPLKKL